MGYIFSGFCFPIPVVFFSPLLPSAPLRLSRHPSPSRPPLLPLPSHPATTNVPSFLVNWRICCVEIAELVAGKEF
ncbi:hypothetical protein F5882DRAFT_416879 [Hyaloscypha sp. PMI_1271]|nr:hypothetical protein F5882DRAFT_416879 [Hyaloscypha sp. PMI_1271]